MVQGARYGRGWTLVELLVVLALLAVLPRLAVPAMSSVIDGVRVQTAARALDGSLRLARSEAIKRNGRVVLCKSAGGVACTRTGGWEQGWIVFHDRNNNGVLDTGEELLLREPALAASLRLSGNGPVQSYVSYTPLGNAQTPGGAFQAGTLTACRLSLDVTPARQVVIGSSGRVRTQKAALTSCA